MTTSDVYNPTEDVDYDNVRIDISLPGPLPASNANTATNPGTVWLNVARTKPSNTAYHLPGNDGMIGCNVGGGGYTGGGGSGTGRVTTKGTI